MDLSADTIPKPERCPECGAPGDVITWEGSITPSGENRWRCGHCGAPWSTPPPGQGSDDDTVPRPACTATVTLCWDDPEDARQFLALHGELCRQGWLPDPSAERLRELIAAATVREDGSDDSR